MAAAASAETMPAAAAGPVPWPQLQAQVRAGGAKEKCCDGGPVMGTLGLASEDHRGGN